MSSNAGSSEHDKRYSEPSDEMESTSRGGSPIASSHGPSWDERNNATSLRLSEDEEMRPREYSSEEREEREEELRSKHPMLTPTLQIRHLLQPIR